MSRRIAVLVKRFPKLSETFILGEIATLIDKGLDIRIISMYHPNEALQQPDAEQFMDRVTYLEPKTPLRALGSFIAALWRNKSSATAILRKIFGSNIDLTELCALLEVCDTLDIVHMHAHYISEPALLAELTCDLRGGSFSVSAHAKDIYLTDANAIRARLENAAFVSTCTAHNYRHLIKLSAGDPANIHLVYHGINSERFRPAENLKSGQMPVIVAIGRFKEKKGFDLLIAACASLLADGVALRCEIIGYGDQQEYLQQLITNYRLGNHIQLRAPVNHDELVGILQNASLCVLPCRQTQNGDRDGIPNALLEAMSCAVPVVSTTVSGIPEVIQSGVNGILVEPENPVALAVAIRSVLDDAILQTRLANGGRQTVREQFSWQANVAVLSEMLGSSITIPNCNECA